MFNTTHLALKTKISMIQMNQVLINAYRISTIFNIKHLLDKWLVKIFQLNREHHFLSWLDFIIKINSEF